ncbi:hypothetical protein [Alkalilimnicola sp. S0819]|uniref:hypothetical protein n=1 Tax=Alkalilimnicola sp. S0819 TaxID=2613922 RepID=UPI0012613CEA|nr:hypothetical protein [Alkalilimnicola sp. S0819]KAB7627522.1 hypothetical protein F3N43_03405 [Alkalilimnicola sp. S0819]MPQ15676.1 hypothetical protein [Alkalilimnicola sp. S0819]
MAEVEKVQGVMDGFAVMGRTLMQQWIGGARALGEQAGSARMADFYTEQLTQAEKSVQSVLQAQRQWLAKAREHTVGASTMPPLPAAVNSFYWDAIELNLELRESLWHTGFDLARSAGEQLRHQGATDQASLLQAWNDMSRTAGTRYREWLQAIGSQADEQAEAESKAEKAAQAKAPAAKNAQRAAKTA